jgi:VIT1/CCC1 family predicted Fe2+/Mn2+ transporter
MRLQNGELGWEISAQRSSGIPIKKPLRMPVRHKERHRTKRIGWLRAAVLGANDGIVSTASLVLGVAAAHGTRSNVLVAGVAGLVTGAMAMAAGEYVSVHSQADTEQAELKRERAELKADDKGEHKELMAIYVGRGLEARVVEQTDLLRVDGGQHVAIQVALGLGGQLVGNAVLAETLARPLACVVVASYLMISVTNCALCAHARAMPHQVELINGEQLIKKLAEIKRRDG